jgi:hypothetical protein
METTRAKNAGMQPLKMLDGQPAFNSSRFNKVWIRLTSSRCHRLDQVYEIRVHTAVEYRICYVAKVTEAIFVLHAFSKRTKKHRSMISLFQNNGIKPSSLSVEWY